MKSTRTRLALEAVRNQIKPVLFQALTAQYTLLLEKGKKEEVLVQDLQPLGAIIKEHTGLDINMVDSKKYDKDAYTMVPDMDANNPIAQDYWRFARTSADGLAKITKAKGAIRGFVDLDTGKVGGTFSQIKIDICIGRGWFNLTKQALSAEELAAITLHEIGHNFTYFETLVEVCTANTVLQAAAQDWLFADRTKRIKLLDAVSANSAIDIDAKTRDSIVNIDEPENMVAVLSTAEYYTPRSMFGTAGNDFSGWETSSDQFAIRMGAGDYIGTGLVKLMKEYPDHYLKTKSYGIASDIFSLLTVGGSIGYAAIGVAIGVAGPALITAACGLVAAVLRAFNDSNETFDIYDSPRKRVERIIVQTRGYLKEPGVDAKRVKEILKNLEVLEEWIGELSKGNRLFEGLINTVFYKRGREIDIRRRHETIESLANNELYAVAASLRQ